MVQKRSEEIRSLIGEVEDLAKSLRTAVRKQAAALPKDVKLLAGKLRKRAAHAASQVEKYAHEVRVELEGAPKKRRPAKRVMKKTAAR